MKVRFFWFWLLLPSVVFALPRERDLYGASGGQRALFMNIQEEEEETESGWLQRKNIYEFSGNPYFRDENWLMGYWCSFCSTPEEPNSEHLCRAMEFCYEISGGRLILHILTNTLYDSDGAVTERESYDDLTVEGDISLVSEDDSTVLILGGHPFHLIR